MALARATEFEFESDLYHVLGLSHRGSCATQEEVRDAYLALAKIHHPDKGGSGASFQALHHAYSVLGDPKAKARYDRSMYMRSVEASEARGVGIPEEHQPEWIRARMRGRQATLKLGRTIGALGLLTVGLIRWDVAWELSKYLSARQLVCDIGSALAITTRVLMGCYGQYSIPVVTPAFQLCIGLSSALGLKGIYEQLADNPREFGHFLRGAAGGLAEGAWSITDLLPPKLLLKVGARVGGPLVNYILPGEECARANSELGEAGRGPKYVYFCHTCREWLCSHCAYHCHKDHDVGRAVPSREVGGVGCGCGVKECADRHREPLTSLINAPTGGEGEGIEDGEWLQIDYFRESHRQPDIDQDYVMIGN